MKGGWRETAPVFNLKGPFGEKYEATRCQGIVPGLFGENGFFHSLEDGERRECWRSGGHVYFSVEGDCFSPNKNI